MKIKLMLVAKSDETRAVLRRALTDDDFNICAEYPGGAAVLEGVENHAPDVLLIHLSREGADVLNLADRVARYRPRTFVALLAEELTMENLRAATNAGIHNITALPADAGELRDYVRGVYNAESVRIDALSQNQRVAWTSKVITVFSAKGGLGKTTLAVNLAVKLAQLQKKVALLDLNLQFGDAHILLDIEPKDTIAELMQDSFTPGIDTIRSYMTVHSSGVHVLCAPKSPEYADIVSAERVASLLSVIRSYYDFVIIDTAPNLSDVTLSAIDASSQIMFVTGLDVSILKNSKLSMGLLESLQQKEKVRVVVNRAVEINTITIDDVQRIIDAPIIARIPSDYMAAVSALNRGVPLVLSNPGCKVSMAIGDIARVLAGGEDNYDIQQLSPKEKKRLLKKYRSKEQGAKKGIFGRRR